MKGNLKITQIGSTSERFILNNTLPAFCFLSHPEYASSMITAPTGKVLVSY